MSKRLEGLYTNCKPNDQPEGYYRDAKNVTLDESLGAIVNELGTENLVSVGDIVGHAVLPNGNIVLFEKGVTDKISVYDGTNLNTIVEKDLNFSSTITCVPYLNEYNEYIIFWVDGVNPARYINITNVESFSNDVYYNLFPATDKLPNTTIGEVFDTGGALKTGAYYFSVAYIHKDGTLTDFYDVTGPAYVTNTDPSESGQPGELTSKSINLKLDNLDPEYESIQIAVIRKIDGIFDSVELLPELPTSVNNFTYTGNEAERPGALEEIQIDNAVYSKPKALAYQDDNLYLGNVEESENEEDFKALQQHVNDVVIKPSIDKTLTQSTTGQPNNDSFSNVSNATKYRGYRRGEVYAFYMSFIRKDGTETKAFHIPGREADSFGDTKAQGKIEFTGGLKEGGGLKAESGNHVIINKARSDGNIIIDYEGEEASVFIQKNSTASDIASKIVIAINNNASMNTEIEAELVPTLASTSAINIKAVNPGTQMNGKRVFIYGDTKLTGEGYNISEQARSERVRNIDGEPSFIFRDARFELTGGTEPLGSEISFTIDTESLQKTIVISNLTQNENAEFLVNEIKDALNADTEFSSNFTASTDTIDSESEVVLTIDANFVGDDYNGSLAIDPKNTYLSLDNDSSFFVVSDLNGGENLHNEKDLIYGPGEEPDQPYKNLEDLQDPRYFRFRSDSSDMSKMGYWENLNETYPDNEETWEDLAGKPVRHHHFPDIIESPYVNRPPLVADFENFNLNPMGFKVENVTIPPSLSEDIVGYKIYYARRTEENKRILDTVCPINARISDDKYTQNNNNKFVEETSFYADDVFYTHPFSYLKDKKNLNNATHLAIFGSLHEEDNDLTEDPNMRLHHIYENIFASKGYINLRIDSAVYVDSDNSDNSGANLKGFGFEKNLDNSFAESKLVLKTQKTETGHFSLTGELSRNKYRLANICSHKTDVYNSFDLQELVYTNYQNTNKTNSTTFENSDTIYGGDTFIVPFSYRIAKLSNINTNYLYTIFMESSDNINLRMRGDEFWEYFYPAATKEDMTYLSFDLNGKDYYDPGEGDVTTVDNYLGYNTDYSEINNIKFPGIYGKQERVNKSYPTRVIRNSGNIRTFKQDDFIDLNKSRGEITKLSNYNNILIPHMERSLVRTRGKEDLQVGDTRAFLGSGDIFSVRPDDVIYTDLGFAGLQNKQSAISTPYGYFFFDQQSERMYSLTNDGIQDVSENILPNIRKFTNVELGYNPKDEVIVVKSANDTYSYSPKRNSWISRHSYSPDYMLYDLNHLYSSKNGSLWKHSEGRPGIFYGSDEDTIYEYVKNQASSYKAGSLLIDSNTHLNYNNVITINDVNFDYDNIEITDGTNVANNTALGIENAYNARLIASVLSNEINRSLDARSLSKDNKIYVFSDNNLEINHKENVDYTGKISISSEEGQELNKNATFDKFRIYNSYQDTKTEDIEYFKDPIENELENIYIGNARNVLKYWVINKFRDVANIPDDVDVDDEWAYKRRMEDKYHIVRLIKDNKYNEPIFLFGSDIVDKTSIR